MSARITDFDWINPYPTVRTPVFGRNVVATSQPLAAQAESAAETMKRVERELRSPAVPFETGAGVCHVFVDEFADINKALPILLNSKTHRPSVCNAAETLLVHKTIAPTFLPLALKALHDAGVALHGDATVQKVAEKFGVPSTLATEENWCTEYGILEMNVAVVESVDAASAHIATI